MKTVNALSKAEVILNGEVVEVIEIKNPCQMWRQLDGWFEKHGNAAEIKVYNADDTLYKDLTIVTQSNGRNIKVNAVKTTNRGYLMKQKKLAAMANDPAEKARIKKLDEIVKNATADVELTPEAMEAAAAIKEADIALNEAASN